MMLSTNVSTAQSKQFCGLISKPAAPHPDSAIVAHDRFGNAYMASELLPSFPPLGGCFNSGFFELDFSAGFSTEEQETICAVFEYLSGLISNPSGLGLRVDIRLAPPSTPDELASGSSFYPLNSCGIEYPFTIYGVNGIPPTPGFLPAMIISVNNEVSQWHTLANDPMPANSNLFDLYSIILHEALHGLGFSSRIQPDGQPTNGVFSNYDAFLETQDGTPLLEPFDGPACCQAYRLNTALAGNEPGNFLASLANNCGSGGTPPRIVFDENNVFPTVNGTGASLQVLSHLDQACDNLPAGEWYVMHHEIDEGELRRTLHPTELDILSLLGYIINNEPGGDCVVAAASDIYNNFSIAPGQSITIPFSFLTGNDVYPSQAVLAYDEGCTEGSEYINVQQADLDGDGQNDAFAITAEPVGAAAGVRFCYTLTCGQRCSNAEFPLTVFPGNVPDCPISGPCDNIVCGGGFESFTPAASFYWAQAGLAPYFTQGFNNSPDIVFEGPPPSGNENQFIRMRPGQNEGLYLPLESSILPGCTLSLSFRVSAGGALLSVLGSEHPPCLLSQPIPAGCPENYGDLCLMGVGPASSYAPHCIANAISLTWPYYDAGADLHYWPTSLIWQEFQITWVNNTGAPVNYLVFQPLPNGNPSVVHLDDVVAVKSCPVTLEINSATSSYCPDTPFEWCFEICAEGLIEAPATLNLEVALPFGFEVLDGEIPATLEFLADGCQEVCLILSAPENAPSVDAAVNLSRCGEILLEETIPLQPDETSCFACEDCPSGNIVGAPGQAKLLTDVLASGALPADGQFVQACVYGTLVVNEDYNLFQSKLLMQPGAKIVVENGQTLALTLCELTGCDNMWRGIEVEKGGALTLKAYNYVADAQYAVYVHAAAEGEPVPVVDIETNMFVDNFAGIYMASTAAAGRVKAFIDGNGFYNVESLLPPFQGQSSAPEGLPQQASESLCGIYLEKLSGFSSTNNTFDGLSSGIVLNSTNGRIYRNIFSSIEPGAYPTYVFEGEAVAGRGTGGHALGVEACTFSNCHAGIVAGQVALSAVSNDMNEVEFGVTASLSNAGNITIGGAGDKRNAIHKSKVGILANHTGTGQVSILNNDISSVAEGWGGGIALFFNHAPAAVKENRVEAYGPATGIALWSCSEAKLLNNHIALMDMPDARAGIALDNAFKCLLQENAVMGPGAGGSENIGYALQFSPDNIYCCNTVDKTRIGVRVMAGCQAEDNFRGTVFGDHATALLLDASGILGAQKHMRNRWTGNGGVEYQGNPDQALQYQFIVDITPPNGLPEYFPPSIIPANWFNPQEDEDEQDVCLEENCLLDGFKPESPDSKRIAKGEVDVGEHTDVVQWHLSRFLYRKLKGYTGEDEDILDFIETSGGNSVGAFDALEEGNKVLLSEGLENQLQVQAKLALISARLKEIGTLDSLYLEADEAGQGSLWLIRGQLLDTMAALARETSGLNEAINHQRSLSARSLIEQNADIETTEVYEQNLKTVTDIYLNYLMEGGGEIPVEDLGVLGSIALQCPLEGGSAVFSARALLAVAARQVSWHDDLECGGGEPQRPSAPVDVQPGIVEEVAIYPNPAKEQVTVDWSRSETPAVNIQLLDIYGKVHQQLPVEPGSLNCVLSTSRLKAGLYMVRVQYQHREVVKKVIINP